MINSPPPPPPVDIIIPVYRDLAVTRRCVESVLAHTPADLGQVILVDDASPEAELSAWCDELMGSSAGSASPEGEWPDNGRVRLLRNASNLGFVASVNRGMAHSGERDVVLLNSDTVVPPNWLERLRRCAYSADDIATVTPFSNNATICSYPFFCQSAPLPDGLDLPQMDALFARANAGQSLEIPTAVGFCMYIRRACLDRIGLFDAERYGRGYGEENDFSRRAAAQGWRNLLCADLFVFHQGAVSFGEDRFALMTAAEALLDERYPSYRATIADFVAADPARPLRNAVDRLRLDVPGQAPVVMAELQAARDGLYQRIPPLEAEIAAYAARCAEYERQLQMARDDYAESSARYQQQLDEVRGHFAATDHALGEAQRIVADAQQRIQLLGDELDSIKNSRTWRLRCWLRQLVDKS